MSGRGICVKISKSLSLADEAIDIEVEGLAPLQKVTLHAKISLPGSAAFESYAHYVADDDGKVQLDKDSSYGGTYDGVEPMGLFWSMVPSPFNKRKHERFLVKDPSQPFNVKISVHDGFVNSLEDIAASPRTLLSQAEARRTYMAPGVQEFNIWHGRVRAVLYLPPGSGPFPGVISFSGGYPGVMKHKPALLASRGFAALGLKFFGIDDLPETVMEGIDLAYFEEAALFLRKHPAVDGRKGVGLIANCLGGWIAVYLASVAPPGLINCVVSISGAIYASESYRYHGRTWDTPEGSDLEIRYDENGLCFWDFKTDIDISDPDNVCSFHQRHDIAYMLIFGSKDGYYKMDQVSQDAKILLEKARHPDYKILYYPGAGHLIEHAYCPFSEIAWTFSELHYNGGEQPFHAKAQIDSWPQILSFVHRRLGSSMPNRSKL